MRTMKKNKGYMALKIDLEKAYDRVRWEFVLRCLQEIGIPPNFIDLVRCCLSTAEMQLIWNGEKGENFLPTRGIRQGDPISPYLFVLVMEKLAHLIQAEVHEGSWLPFKLKRQGTTVSHVFFADDLILFAEATSDQAAIIKACLDDFCAASGEKVNEAKSRIFFSNNVCHVRRKEISDFLGFSPTTDLGKYLGVPVQHHRVSKSMYDYVLNRMDTKLSNWKAHTLSMAARHTLITSVASAVPAYTMQSTLLPVSVCDDIDKKCRNFLWGTTESHRRIHHVAWEDVCLSKSKGGAWY